MSKTNNLIAELTEDHPIFKAALAAYNDVRTVQAKKTVMNIVIATLKEMNNYIFSENE